MITKAEIDLDDVQLVSNLERLVSAAGLGSANKVPSNGHTLHNLRRSLQHQARFLKQLHPMIAGPEGEDLLRRARAREWHVH